MNSMANLTLEGVGTFDVTEDTRLVKAIEDSDLAILHRCGGHAKCTICRVSFIAGEPRYRREAERVTLAEKGASGIRLSCQCLVEGDMYIHGIHTLQSTGLDSPGDEPANVITPEPVWIPLEG